VIAVDASLLVYAHVTAYPQHDGARQWIEEQLAGSVRVGLPWASLLAFMRLVTNPRLFSEPESIIEAWEQVEAWLDAAPVWLPAPTSRHREVLRSCIRQPGLRANDVPDALPAPRGTGRRTRTQLATSDHGFARFERLAWFDPLSPA
jgi:toxin-antitoxin system PIN domain toxin